MKNKVRYVKKRKEGRREEKGKREGRRKVRKEERH